jgi:type II secretion system protein C
MARQRQWMFILPCLALAAWLVAGTIRVIMADPLRDNPFHLPNQTGSAPEFLPGDEAQDNHIVVERNYFRSSLRPPIPEPPVPGRDFLDPGQPSPLAARLIGTVVASQEDWSLALISAGGENGLYRLGDALLDDAVVVAVLADKVVLERRGGREYLSFERNASPSVAVQRIQLPLKMAAVVKPDGPGRYLVDRDELQKLLAQPGDLLRKTRITLAFDKQGEIEGIRLVAGRAVSIFSQAGLRNGDVIHRIGPYVINGPERILEIYKKLKNARELDLELSRGGQRKTLRYRID